jgi:anti-sigma regulatory factor (Ser/Thr protein kinase)/class 3 adenylate cyclase
VSNGSPILIFAGERIGAADSFPSALEESVREAIRGELAAREARLGYSSASAGADILFCEELLASGAELRVFLPCVEEDFIAQHVAPAGDHWIGRYRTVIEGAAQVEVSCEERLLGDEALLTFNNQMLQGMGRLHALRAGVPAHLLLAFSPGAPAEAGSPADFMDQWPEPEHLSIIDLDDLRERAGIAEPPPSFLSGFPSSPRAIRAILFADIATYTKYPDEQVPLLWDFLAGAQDMIASRTKPPLLINSWGDAVHAAAETAHDLADYATALTDAIATLDIAPFGLDRRPLLRMALHAGPVFVGIHPLTGRSMIYGHHVNRAARIEPIATPGETCASQHFVALLRSEMDSAEHEARVLGIEYQDSYCMEYVGLLDLPKRFGRESIYRVFRRSGGEDISTNDRPQSSELRLAVSNDLAVIARIASAVDSFCAERRIGTDIAYAVNLAIDELLTNTISYGYRDRTEHTIEIVLGATANRLTLVIRDDGEPFDPTLAAAPDVEAEMDERAVGGLGIHLVRTMMDSVEYRRSDGHNEVTLTKLLES